MTLPTIPSMAPVTEDTSVTLPTIPSMVTEDKIEDRIVADTGTLQVQVEVMEV